MNSNQIIYRTNAAVSVFHIIMMIVVLATGGLPWLQVGLFAINGSVAGYHYRKEIKSRKAPQAIESVRLTEFDCAQFETRHFEQKLIDSGVMKPTEMSVCDNLECVNCSDTRRQIDAVKRIEARNRYAETVSRRAENKKYSRPDPLTVPKPKYNDKESDYERPSRQHFEYLRRTHPKWKGYRFEDYLFQMRMIEANKQKAAQRENLRQLEREKAVIERNRRQARFVDTELGKLRLPNNVPKFAHATPCYTAGSITHILWTWQYDPNGKVFHIRMPVESESIEMMSGDGNRWKTISITDPDTGEHLGNINVYDKVLEMPAGGNPVNLDEFTEFLEEGNHRTVVIPGNHYA